ncbi:MAG: T9SS type A sorting domain-containing protein [Bacteroidota bacterium]
MKRITNFVMGMLLLFALPCTTYGQLVSEGFETSTCSNTSQAFFQGCFTDWINVSGTADVNSNYSGISPSQGSRYIHMYTEYDGFNCISVPQRAESIALNYNFQAGQTYTITYDIRWSGATSSCHSSKSEWILTSGKANQSGGTSGCPAGEALPAVSGSDQIIKTHNMSGTTGWQSVSVTFTPTSSYSQLWFRPAVDRRSSCSITSQATAQVYLDDFELTGCTTSGYSTLFSLSASSDFAGNVTANTQANSNPVFVNHWWDVFYAPGGSTSGNSQVPGNPIQCCTSTTASFSNNLVVNEWYYIKHGIWNECISWRETRKRFRVTIGFSPIEPKYRLEVEDVDFLPTDAYLVSMNRMAQELSSQEIEEHNQQSLSLLDQVFNASLSNQPNPFSEVTQISYRLDTERLVSLHIYDATGRKVTTLLDENLQTAGQHQVKFDGRDLPNGIYFSVLQAGSFQETQKMIIAR